MKEVLLAGAVRTPVGKFGGGLSELPATQLGAIAIKESLKRAKVDPAQVDYAIMGNVLTANEGQAPARQAAIRAGIPDSVSALTINKVCASGLMSVALAAQAIRAGDAEVVVAGGMENMSLAPHMIVNSRTGFRLGDVPAVDHMLRDGLWCPFENRHMGNSAEAIAAKHGIPREAQDAFALRSQQRAVAATREGVFSGEIVPVEVKRRKETVLLDRDEGPRADTSASSLAALRPAFPPGQTVTAGNASQISDGAASVVVLESARAKALGVHAMARIIGYAHAANAPAWLFDAPVLATRKLLEKTRTNLDGYDLIEINEAFAAQVLANEKELRWDWDKVNVTGGAIAIGHPIGASGARVLVTLLHGMKRRKAKRGMAVICHGGGGAVAMAIESL
ncbi:MAG: acetyl-CoA C-acetyltransferase [Chloroflexi bacterium]|nr:acetyl-CoA C-acetyltransferase [Chloroflexota bacterium]